MLDKSYKEKDNSYSPYSKFRVGTCVLTKSGNFYVGTNVENASYEAIICGERCAIFNTVANGEKEILAIATSIDLPTLKFPCGACRQVMNEFKIEWVFA